MTIGNLILILMVCIPFCVVIAIMISFLLLNRDIEQIIKIAIKKALYEIYEERDNE